MTKAVLELESDGEARRTTAAVQSPALARSAAWQASLMARLDRLGPAKEVAQIGAAIGREVFARSAGCDGRQTGSGVGIGARPSLSLPVCSFGRGRRRRLATHSSMP